MNKKKGTNPKQPDEEYHGPTINTTAGTYRIIYYYCKAHMGFQCQKQTIAKTHVGFQRYRRRIPTISETNSNVIGNESQIYRKRFPTLSETNSNDIGNDSSSIEGHTNTRSQ